MSLIEIQNIRKNYGALPAVKGIDLIAHDGEMLVLLGPSGCGKSTLMRIIAGIETATSGDILIDKQSILHKTPKERNVAMVFQTYALYPHMTVRQNIEFPLKKMRAERARIDSQVAWAANMFRISGLLDRKPKQLSGGERQRVALARAMVRNPSLFMLDEPLSNLDAKLRASAREEILQFQRQSGTTTLYVTHDQVEAMALGDRIAVLNEGTVRQVGSPQDIYHRPADIFVATFVGSPTINLIEENGVTIGFRPERLLRKTSMSPGEDVIEFPLVVTRIEDLGSTRLVYGELRSPHPPTKVVADVPAMAGASFAAGEEHIFCVRQSETLEFRLSDGRLIRH